MTRYVPHCAGSWVLVQNPSSAGTQVECPVCREAVRVTSKGLMRAHKGRRGYPVLQEEGLGSQATGGRGPAR